MAIDFGKVEKYNKGFGVVSHTFLKVLPVKVFFHINIVHQTHPELARSLGNPKNNNSIYFWYEFHTSPQDDKVVAILDVNTMRLTYTERLAEFVEIIKEYWMKVEMPLPESIRKATFDLFTSDEASQLAAIRESTIEKHKLDQVEIQRVAAARHQEIAEQRAAQEIAESARRQEIAVQSVAQDKSKEEEFRQLVAEMSALGFTHSRQVSDYIVRHRLGNKYKHISGILQMGLDGEVWNFNGGFPPNIYAKLCDVLGLGNQGSRAKPLGFTSYNDIINH